MHVDAGVVGPSIFKPNCHSQVDRVIRDVEDFYITHWDFEDEKTKSKFRAAGISRVTCLYFPKALDSRIAYACSLQTILFLVDDMIPPQLRHVTD